VYGAAIPACAYGTVVAYYISALDDSAGIATDPPNAPAGTYSYLVNRRVGDLNCDGSVNFADINPFVLYLSSFPTWQAAYPSCPPQNGDVNEDGTYPSFGDINPFVTLLAGG
jgi:hypothetical protein